MDFTEAIVDLRSIVQKLGEMINSLEKLAARAQKKTPLSRKRVHPCGWRKRTGPKP